VVGHLYDWFGLNVVLFHLINGLHAPWWDRVMLAMTWLGNYELYPYYLAIVLLLAQAAPRWLPRRNVAVFAVGYALTAIVVSTLKPLLAFPRPLQALGRTAVVVLGEPALHESFPSGHATFVALLAASLSARSSRPWRWALWLFAALVCISRVAVGAHFPADVLGGTLIGMGAAGLAMLLVRALTARN
jgi:undecaprenyl-diphosphatase